MVFMPNWPKQLGYKPMDFGTERVEELLGRLGNPHHSLPPVVHIAGTNGKGSTLSFLRAFLEAAGYKVHTYTSPHIVHFNERIVLAGYDISDHQLAQISDECRIAANDMRITFFEGTTVMAMLAFSKVEADIILLETGMGGRLDATNIFDQPACSIITPISLDHVEYLGEDITTIAKEKAAIIKREVPCVSSMQFEDAHIVLEQKAEEMHAPLFAFGYDWVADKTDDGMVYKSQRGDLELPRPSLLGDHQIINAGTAITAVKCLQEFNIPDSAIIQGLQNTKWIARMQQLPAGKLLDRLPKGWEIWLDGAHNPAGAHMLSCIAEDWVDKPTYLICGFTRGRDGKEFFSYFQDKIQFACGVLVETEMSAQKAEIVAHNAQENGIEASPCDSLEDALYKLKKRSESPARIIICGSLYLCSDALKANAA